MILSSGQLLAANNTSLTQYIQWINRDSTKLIQTTNKENITMSLLVTDLAAKTTADSALTTATTAYNTALSTLTADSAKLAADNQAALAFPGNHKALIAADDAKVKELAAKVKADPNNSAQKQADMALLSAAKDKEAADRMMTNASLLAAIAAEKAQLLIDHAAIITAKGDLTLNTTLDKDAAARVIKIESQLDTLATVLTDLHDQYNKDFASCTAAYSASAC